MGYYSSEIPDFEQAVEAVLVKHGLVAEQPTEQPAEQGDGQGDQSGGQHADPAGTPV